MTNEAAALLAQVLPVIALALGLELRSLRGRMAALPAPQPGTRAPAPLLVAPLGLVAMAVLASREMHALDVIIDSDPAKQQVYVLIIVVFMAPAVELAWQCLRHKVMARVSAVTTCIAGLGLAADLTWLDFSKNTTRVLEHDAGDTVLHQVVIRCRLMSGCVGRRPAVSDRTASSSHRGIVRHGRRVAVSVATSATGCGCQPRSGPGRR